MRVNREVTLAAQYRLLEETGRIDNFRYAAGKDRSPNDPTGQKPLAHRGRYYNDSDVYKWLEAVGWALACEPDADLTQMANTVIKEIVAAQGDDGYLNTYFSVDRASERWTNLRDMHELYCAGHLMQAAVAHHRATGETRLLTVARRLADYIDAVFGPSQDGKRSGVPGHEEIEMALVELARETGESRYQELAQFFVDSRGRGLIGGSPYHQDHLPFREMDRLVGHAVRAVYLTAGATDIYAETGEAALHDALNALWFNMTTRQMYVSGGIGSRYSGESFGDDYELPNARAYAETCAAIGSFMWNWRMLALEGDARFADVMELALYNGFLASLSLDGERYFYPNPLADEGTHRRQPWFDCACCPPNIARLLASLPGYFYSSSDDGIWVHQYAEGSAQIHRPDSDLPEKDTVELIQRTRYPWDGEVTITVQGQGLFSLYLRVPGWCADGAAIQVNGQMLATELVPGSYAKIRRAWRPGDTVRLELPMTARMVDCHPYVTENADKIALMRGPLLYCLESVDNPGLDLRDVTLDRDTEFAPVQRIDLLGGVVALQGQSLVDRRAEAWVQQLYRAASATPRNEDTGTVDVQQEAADVVAIPYYAWANREAGQMRVWLTCGPNRQ
jgi:DUF1680 family protein